MFGGLSPRKSFNDILLPKGGFLSVYMKQFTCMYIPCVRGCLCVNAMHPVSKFHVLLTRNKQNNERKTSTPFHVSSNLTVLSLLTERASLPDGWIETQVTDALQHNGDNISLSHNNELTNCFSGL